MTKNLSIGGIVGSKAQNDFKYHKNILLLGDGVASSR
jgi:hypothetical protein